MFSIDASTLPSVSSYQGAINLFEKLPEPKTPLQHNEKLLKGVARDRAKRIRRSAGTVSFIYHDTPLVSWHGEDRLTVIHHSSVSSRAFIDRFLPKGMWVRGYRGATAVNGYLAKNGPTDWYLRNGNWQPDPNDVQAQYKLRLNRKKAEEIKAHVMPFLEWRDGLNALQGEAASHWRPTPPLFAIKELLDDKDPWRYSRLRPHIQAKAEEVLNMAYSVGGAVEHILLPPGELPAKGTWDKWRHLLPVPII